MNSCKACESDPCLWIEHHESVLSEIEIFKEEKVAKGEACPNNVCRKHGYRHFSLLIYGHLGKGQRVKLPGCIEEGVRSKYPNQSGKAYMGYKQSDDTKEESG